MNIIVAVDANWAIGNKGELLVSIPQDHKMFREETLGKTIVFGHRTLDTFPQKKPLDGRLNIILSKDTDLTVKGAVVVNSLEELKKELEKVRSEDVYIIGGDSVYKQLLPMVDVVHVTKIDCEYEADAYFPNLDESEEWEITDSSEEQYYFDLTYFFLKYERKKQ